ncbi:MAG: hypothetical protein H0W74_08345 [Sphingosinicella sp.]|nr:hypothetical protein [Sphingosinicella sp.]
MKKLIMMTAGLAVLASLAACDDGAPAPNVKKIQVADSGAYLDKLRGLSPQNRDLVLRRAVQDADLTCKRVKSSAESGRYENMVMWTLRCEGDDDWAVFIAPSGDAQVRSCGDLGQLGLPTCKLN